MLIPASVSYLKRTLIVGIATTLLAVSALMPLVNAAESNPRDCDENAVLRCGAYTTGEVNEKYDASPTAKTIFHHFEISSIDVNNLGSTAKNGYVTPGGRVMIGDETVATNATTAGRQNMPGSQQVTANGTTFYTRSTDVSLNNGKLEAYVVMKDGKFDFAIIKACGNPVTATPKEPPAPTPTPPAPTPTPPAPAPEPTPPAPTPAPTPTPVVCGNVGDNSTGANCNTCVGTNVCNVTTPPAPQSTAQCVQLTLRPSDNRTVTASVSGSAYGATITGYRIDFGDGTAPVSLSADNNNDAGAITTASSSTQTAGTTTMTSSTSTQAKYQYTKDGSYPITGYVAVTYADGRTDSNVTSVTCKSSVSYNTPVTPVAAPPAPATPAAAPVAQTLPNAGMSPAQSIVLAIIIGIASSIGYAYFTSLRLKKIPVRH